MKFDDPRVIYSRTAAQQLATTDETYLDIAIYSRSNIPDFQLVYIPMSFQNCYYNTFSDQFSKVKFFNIFLFILFIKILSNFIFIFLESRLLPFS
jgi:hypothetical protein